MLLFDQNIESVFFFGPKKKFSEIYRQFRFWGQNLFFQLFARTFFSIVYNFVKNWPILTIEATDSLTDGASGLVGKRGDTAMRELFFSFK